MDTIPDAAVVRVTRRRAQARDWLLVLGAEGLAARTRETPEGLAIEVAAEQFERAAAVLETWDRENATRPEPAPRGPAPDLSPAGFVIGGLLVAFFLVSGAPDAELSWVERGSADARRIGAGEPWRAVTALTLHADLPHALANAASATVFVGAVCGLLGVGLGSATVLASGALGNLANAWVRGGDHHSVGASTAVFGAVGLLCALAFAHRRRGSRRRRAALAVGAGLALLAMLGTAGERVDLWAHLFGLLAGLLVAAPLALLGVRRPGRGVQIALGAAALAVVVASWLRALSVY